MKLKTWRMIAAIISLTALGGLAFAGTSGTRRDETGELAAGSILASFPRAEAPGFLNTLGTVTVGPACSLSDAIITANSHAPYNGCSDPGVGTVTIMVPAGTYTLTSPYDNSGQYEQPSGLPAIDSSVIIQGAGRDSTIIERSSADATPQFAIFVTLSGSLTVNDVTIRNGYATRSGGAASNRSLGNYNQPAPLAFNNCRFVKNRAAYMGGAIMLGDAGVAYYGGPVPPLDVNNCEFIDNTAGSHGGAIETAGTTHVTDSTFTGNYSSGQGGAIHTEGYHQDLTVTRSRIVNNRAMFDGGGIDVRGSTSFNLIASDVLANYAGRGGIFIGTGFPAAITDSRIEDNVSQDFSGGLNVQGVGGLNIIRTTLARNQSFQGGGNTGGAIYFEASQPMTLTDCTISGNRGYGIVNGGGVSGYHSSIDLNGVTITGNTAPGLITTYGAAFNLTNTIIAGNDVVYGRDLQIGHASSGSLFNSVGHNLIGNATGANFINATGDLVGNDQSPLDVRLAPLGFNGGLTETHALLAGSPAVDAGGADAPATDQRGRPRPAGSASDIGAFESDSVAASPDLSVFKTADATVAHVGLPLTYHIVVSANGASNFDGVTVTDALPASESFVSANATQGACSESGGTVTCNLGTVAGGANVTITLIVTPNVTGVVSNTASVTTSTTDSDAADNSSTSTLPITNAISVNVGCTLKDAIKAANSDSPVGGCPAGSGADLILLPAGTITLTEVDNYFDNQANGLPLISGPLTIRGAGRDATVIERSTAQGTPNFRLMQTYFSGSSYLLAVEDMTLRGGYAVGGNGSARGGAISGGREGDLVVARNCRFENNVSLAVGGGISSDYVEVSDSAFVNNSAYNGNSGGAIAAGSRHGSLDVTRSTFEGNYAYSGAAIDAGVWHASITDSTFTNNTAQAVGGAVSGSGTSVIRRSTFTGNKSGDNCCNGGGGALAVSNYTVSDSTFTNNFSHRGGAVTGANDTFTRVSFTGNTARDHAGALEGSGLTVNESTFANNRALYNDGGAIIADGLVMTNSTITGNSAGRWGGAIFASRSASPVSLTHVTISGNQAGQGSGLFVDYSSGGQFTLRDTIIAGNSNVSAGDVYCDTNPIITSLGHNIIGNGAGLRMTPVAGDQIGTPSAPVDPMLAPLADNGGPTQTRALFTGSPAIDAGDCALPTDQRGAARPQDGDGDGIAQCDIGAAELVVPYVRPSCAPPAPSLIALYKGEGTGNDSSGGGHHGTLRNGVYATPGKVGKALGFDGYDDYVEIPDDQALRPSAFTVEAWIKPNGGGTILSKGSSGSGGLSTDSDTIAFYVDSNTSQIGLWVNDANGNDRLITGNVQVLQNQWNYVAASFDGTTRKLYVNGWLAGTDTVSPGMRYDANPVPLLIGEDWVGGAPSRQTGRSYQFRGAIDELAFYGAALSDADIQATFNAGASGHCVASQPAPPTCPAAPAGLAALYRADNTGADSSGNGLDATLQNGAGFAPGEIGQAFSLDGNDDFIIVPDSPALSPPLITVGGWFKITQAPPANGDYVLASKYGGPPWYNGWMLRVYNAAGGGQMYANFELLGSPSAIGGVDSSTTFPVNAWTHIAATYDGASLKIYVNGAPAGSDAYSGGYVPSALPMWIGGANWYGGELTRGMADEFAIFNRPLSPSEIQSIYAAGSAGMCQAPTPPPTPTPTPTPGPSPATISLSNLAQTYDGSPKTVTVTTTPANLSGLSVTYDGSTTAPTNAGNYAVVASLANADYVAQNAAGTLVINKADQTINFAPLADKTYGDAPFTLSATSTSALPVTFQIVSGPASLSGNTLTISGAGSVKVRASQDGDSNYNAAPAVDRTFNVAKAHASVTLGGLAYTYDSLPKAATATTTPANLGVTLAYTQGTPPVSVTSPTNAGSYAVVATITDANYDGTATGTLIIGKASPIVSWSNPSAIVYGTPLGSTQLNASADTPGTFVYEPAGGTVLTAAKDQALTTTFTPADTANYAGASATVHIDVSKAVPAVVWTDPADITYGSPLGSAQLNASSPVAGSFSYSPPAGTVLQAGNGQLLSTVFTPSDTSNYTSANASAHLNVRKAIPTVSWNTPGDITYGTALGNAQLNAAFNVAGTVAYAPAAGAVLGAGTRVLTATLTPSDSNNYAVISKSVSINVLKAPLTVTADPKTKQFSDPLPLLTATLTGFVNNENESALRSAGRLSGSALLSTTATAASPSAASGSLSYPITASTGTLSADNYSFPRLVSSSLTVLPEDAVLTYTGDSLVTTSASSTSVNLSATVVESQDGSPGNKLTGLTVRFSLYKSSNTTMTTADQTATAVISGAANAATTTVSLPADNYTVKLELLPNAFYLAPVENAVLSVALAASGMTNGGGWLIDPNPENNPSGYRSNFGFTAKVQNNGNVQGNSLFVYRTRVDLGPSGGPAGLRDYNFVVKSSSITSVQVANSPSGKPATFSGKCSIMAIDRQSGAALSKGGGYLFRVDVTDKGEPGSGVANPDTYAIRVFDTTGTLLVVGSYSASGSNLTQLPISGGNVQVK